MSRRNSRNGRNDFTFSATIKKKVFRYYIKATTFGAVSAKGCLHQFGRVATNLNEVNMMTENEITFEVRGAIYDVYKNLGPGLLESVYEEAMVYELRKRGLAVERQKDVPILYDGHVLKTELRIDLLVESKVVVELKSVQEMRDVFWKQTRTYLRLLGLKVGILVNFNVDNILNDAIHRVVNNF